MKCMLVVLVVMVFTAGCSNSGSGSGTSVQGTWTVTGSLGSEAPRTYHVSLVPSPCSVTTAVGTFSVTGPVCFTANNNAGEGSISGPGISISSIGQGVLIGVASNPVRANGTFNLVFVAGNKSGTFVEFTGSGTFANGTVTGTESCSPSTPVCQGMSATFSGNQQ
jgi:hypothetical protein